MSGEVVLDEQICIRDFRQTRMPISYQPSNRIRLEAEVSALLKFDDSLQQTWIIFTRRYAARKVCLLVDLSALSG
jgi:hypothetical protein